METITIENDIPVFYKTAASFPEGVLEAHQALHELIPFTADRMYFGISRPENGVITYRAAAEEKHPGEGLLHGCDTMVLKKGRYVAITIYNFLDDIQSIGQAFEMLLTQPGIDTQGYCVEYYLTDHDVRCMIRLAN